MDQRVIELAGQMPADLSVGDVTDVAVEMYARALSHAVTGGLKEKAIELAQSPSLDEASRTEARQIAATLEYGQHPRVLEMVRGGVSIGLAADTVAADEARRRSGALLPGSGYADPQDLRTWGAA